MLLAHDVEAIGRRIVGEVCIIQPVLRTVPAQEARRRHFQRLAGDDTVRFIQINRHPVDPGLVMRPRIVLDPEQEHRSRFRINSGCTRLADPPPGCFFGLIEGDDGIRILHPRAGKTLRIGDSHLVMSAGIAVIPQVEHRIPIVNAAELRINPHD